MFILFAFVGVDFKTLLTAASKTTQWIEFIITTDFMVISLLAQYVKWGGNVYTGFVCIKARLQIDKYQKNI